MLCPPICNHTLNRKTEMNTESNYIMKASFKIDETPESNRFVTIHIQAFPVAVVVTTTRGNSVTEALEVVEKSLLWEELDNVETLADVFAAERVDVFARIVKMLGNLHRLETHVKELIAEEA